MKKKKLFRLIVVLTLIVLNIVSLALFSYSLYLYKGVETFYRYYGIGILLFIFLVTSYSLLRSIKKQKWIKFIISVILTVMFVVAEAIGYYYLTRVYKAIDSFSTSANTYYSSLITFNKKYNSYKDLKDKKIGIVNDELDIESYVLPNEIIKKLKLETNNEIVKYDSAVELMHDLSTDTIDAGFFSSNYAEMFSTMEGYENVGTLTKELYKYEKVYEKSEDPTETIVASADLTKPFTMLLIGVDSSKDGVTAGYNADVLILVTFNPKTLQATMTSVPRDMYLQTACSGSNYRRINTTTWGSSSSCAVQTMEKLFDVNIDYYAKINFKGVVQLVDAVGGIDVEVPFDFCEQNSNRSWEKDSIVYVKKGMQHLNGEQALALARHRKTTEAASFCDSKWTSHTSNDYVRGKNQMKVIVGVANQIRTLTSANQAIEILETISKNFQTNVNSQKILSLYDLAKTIAFSDKGNIVNVQRMQLSGYSLKVWDPLSKSYPSVAVPSTGSIKVIKDEIKINLGKKTAKMIKTTAFDLNELYKDEVIGSNTYSGTRLTTLKDLSSYTVANIKSYASSNGLSLKFLDADNGSEVSISSWGEYKFYKQKEHKDTILKLLNSLTIYVKKGSTTTTKLTNDNNTSSTTDKTDNAEKVDKTDEKNTTTNTDSNVDNNKTDNQTNNTNNDDTNTDE